MNNEKTVSGCQGCLKIESNCGIEICSVFKDPAFQHRNGKCPGYTEKPGDMVRMYVDLVKYAEHIDSPSMVRVYSKKVEEWHQRIKQDLMAKYGDYGIRGLLG